MWKGALSSLLAIGTAAFWIGAVHAASIEKIDVIVVIYAENRSFDHLYGLFPGANGLQHLTPTDYAQTDRDGSVLPKLPPIWGGLTPEGVSPQVTQARKPADLPVQQAVKVELRRLSQIAQSIALENQVFASFTDQRRLRWISQRERTIERGLRHLLSN